MREIIAGILDRMRINEILDSEHYYRLTCSESIYNELQKLFSSELQKDYPIIRNVFIPGYGTLELEKAEDDNFKPAIFEIKRMSPKIVKNG